MHRRTVRQAIESAQPPVRKTPVRTARVLEDFKPAIEAMLQSDLEAPRKQRHTIRRVLARLVDEHGAEELSVLDSPGLRGEAPSGGAGPSRNASWPCVANARCTA